MINELPSAINLQQSNKIQEEFTKVQIKKIFFLAFNFSKIPTNFFKAFARNFSLCTCVKAQNFPSKSEEMLKEKISRCFALSIFSETLKFCLPKKKAVVNQRDSFLTLQLLNSEIFLPRRVQFIWKLQVVCTSEIVLSSEV